MPLDRQSIEKKDFPIGRRGYDPEAVDAHLTWIAREIEELKLSSRRRTETLATSASEQVRAIVEAAEASATQIQSEAETQAREIRTEAAAEADAARTEATTQARSYVSRVSESTAVMMQRLEAMQSELGNLTDSLRTGANRLNADLQLLDGNFDDVRGAVGARGHFESEAEPADAGEYDTFDAEREPVNEPAGTGSEASESELADRELSDREASELEVSPAADGDIEGARLIALNMALNGTAREETDRYLALNFELSDRAQLLDEVYASVEG
jgi:DivIVA domain-containing protein